MQENKQTPELGADLEMAAPLSKHSATQTADLSNLEFLKTSPVKEFLTEDVRSSKFDAEREDRIQAGLIQLSEISINDVKINELILLLGKWWEHKGVRAQIKKLIDLEAEQNGYAPEIYMQEILAAQIEQIAEIQTAIDRLRYCKTYYKPRRDLTNKVITQLISIDGVYYNVPLTALIEAKNTYDKNDSKQLKAMKKFLVSISTPSETVEVL